MTKNSWHSLAKRVKPPMILLRAHPRIKIFPIKSGEKYPPRFAGNLRLASNESKQINDWEKRYGPSNWGIALAASHLIVPDVDTRDGKRGAATLERLEFEHGPLPRTLTVRTPSGGLHYYYNEANGVRHQMRVSAFGPEINSTNYVLAPGCRLSSGGSYDIVDDAPIADAPAWFGEYLDTAPLIGDNSDQAPAVDLDQPQNTAWAKHYLKNDAPPSVQGRNGEYTLLMVAARLKDHGISELTAVELLAEHYNMRCEPRWSIGNGELADRLDVKVHNAWAYLTQTTPGAHTAQAEFGDAVVDSRSLDATIAWWRRRTAAEAEGEQPTNRERAQGKRRKP